MPQENKKKERVKKMIKFGKWVVKFRIPILILSFFFKQKTAYEMPK